MTDDTLAEIRMLSHIVADDAAAEHDSAPLQWTHRQPAPRRTARRSLGRPSSWLRLTALRRSVAPARVPVAPVGHHAP